MNSSRWVGLHWFVFACIVSGTLVFSRVGGLTAEPDLTGVVKDQEGKPLPKASVFIYTAGPKEGNGILCPSCYADCRKSATTDDRGHFKIEKLDPTLVFRVLVVAKGCRPEFVAKVDPAVKPIEVTLKPAKEGLSPGQQMKGRVTDPKGQPVAGAVVNIRGVTRNESTRFGGNVDMDQVAVSDEEGNFVINGESSFDAVGVEVEARGFAKGIFQKLTSGDKIHDLKLTEGASVQGHLLDQGGKPVAGAEVAVCGADRAAESYVGDYSVGTDKSGRFLLVNLPPNRDYFLYARMNSIGKKGAVAARRIRITGDGSMVDATDVKVIPAFKLEGQIRLTDGQPVPLKTRVLLSRDEAWDSTQTEVDSEGRFSFTGVPPEAIQLSARIQGFRLSSHNRSLDTMNPFHLVGTLRADKTDLIVEFEPGKDTPGSRGAYIDIRQEPLIGAEAVKSRQGDFHVTGTVSDAETGKPLETFTATEGRAGSLPDTTDWFEARQTPGTNGQLDVFLNKGRGAPAIMVQADGYLPQASGPITSAETNLVFALKKGSGPAGVVLKPDGQPAAAASVYLADMRNGVYVQDNDMKVQTRVYQATRSTKTDENGRFRFTPRVDDYAVLILEEDGFAQVTIEDLKRDSQIKLQPWARVQGKLMIGTKPGANETIRLGLASIPYEFHPRNFNPLSLFLVTKTDDTGNFTFDRVPPINLQVYHSPAVKDDKMGTIPMSQAVSFHVNPGETKTLTLGGKGRPVTGQLVVNGYEGKIDWRSDVYTLDSVNPPSSEVPDLLALSRENGAKIRAAASDEEKKRLSEEFRKDREQGVAKLRDFYASERGREYYFKNNGRYALNFAADGTFRVEDVPGGKYRLRVDLREGGSGPMRFSAPLIASLEKEVVVPDSPGGRTDEPFSLGKIEMQARKILASGKAAPDFEVKTVDDKTVKLSDFAGKYLLLDFWAVWCGPCVAETPHLKATYAAFKDDPRFRMLGLSLDPIAKTPRDYAQKNELGWTMGFLGEWSKTDVPNQYGVEGIPAIFLIGPDGKIIAKDLRGEGIRSAIEKALQKSQTASGR